MLLMCITTIYFIIATFGLTYFSRSRCQDVKIQYWVNWGGGTNRNCCTQTLVIFHAQTYLCTLIAHGKLGNSILLYGPKSLGKKVGVDRRFQAS